MSQTLKDPLRYPMLITSLNFQGTFSKDKNEILFAQFGINYNSLPAMFRKGSILVRESEESVSVAQQPQDDDAASASELQNKV